MFSRQCPGAPPYHLPKGAEPVVAAEALHVMYEPNQQWHLAWVAVAHTHMLMLYYVVLLVLQIVCTCAGQAQPATHRPWRPMCSTGSQSTKQRKTAQSTCTQQQTWRCSSHTTTRTSCRLVSSLLAGTSTRAAACMPYHWVVPC